MDERDRLIADTAAMGDDLLAGARRERDRLHAAGEDASWIETFIAEAETAVAGLHDMVLIGAIRDVIQRHGPGPYTDEDIAAIVGAPLDDVRRVLADMQAHGMLTRERIPDF